MQKRVSVFVDGENIGSAHAEAIAGRAARRGDVVIARVYGDVSRLNGWQEARGYSIVHTGKGKNATDLLLSLDAFELALQDQYDVCVVASFDRDFSHLAVKLRERGIRVVGTGPETASCVFVGRCSEFEKLPGRKPPTPSIASSQSPADDLDTRIREVMAKHGDEGAIRITDLNSIMWREHDLRISERVERKWRRYFEARHHLYRLLDDCVQSAEPVREGISP
jgi:hypothetical protein